MNRPLRHREPLTRQIALTKRVHEELKKRKFHKEMNTGEIWRFSDILEELIWGDYTL